MFKKLGKICEEGESGMRSPSIICLCESEPMNQQTTHDLGYLFSIPREKELASHFHVPLLLIFLQFSSTKSDLSTESTLISSKIDGISLTLKAIRTEIGETSITHLISSLPSKLTHFLPLCLVSALIMSRIMSRLLARQNIDIPP